MIRRGPGGGTYTYRTVGASPTVMHVVIVTIDCGRADHFDGRSGLTPRLDEIRNEGTTFTAAFAQSQNTLSSHLSILTSNYLFQHGVYRNFVQCELPGHAVPLKLAEKGYDCAAFTGVHFLARALGDQFTPFDTRYPHEGEPIMGRLRRWLRRDDGSRLPAERSVGDGLSWLDGSTATDRFLWLHFFDTHMVYSASKELIDRHAPTERSERTCVEQIQEKGWFHSSYPALEQRVPLGHFPARYRASVAHVDQQLGVLVDGLRERGLWDETLLIVTADHGECLEGDHGLYCVHKKLYDTTVHVPLWIRFPGGAHAGVTVDGIVELVDVAPTIARVTGYEEPLYMGRDLGAIASGALPAREFAFAEHVDDLLRAMRDGEHVWVETLPDRVNRSGFPLDEGSFFRRDGSLAREGCEDSEARLEAAARELLSSRPEVAEAWGQRQPVTDKIARQLRRLGYL